jgi:spore coat protein A, manganese oxidase
MLTRQVTRRTFLKATALATAGSAMPLRWPGTAYAADSRRLRKFIQPLRRVGASGGIPLAQPDTGTRSWWQPGATHYTIDIAQFSDQLHPDLPNPTRLWGFGQGTRFEHLGGIIAVKRGTPVQVTFRNLLPAQHILPVDKTIMGAEGPENRASVHLHGAFVPWVFDGGPHAWWTPSGERGPSFLNNKVLRPGQTVRPWEAEYHYPNDQSARLLWYHDHALGNTRLNAYAGIASGYVIYDDYELDLVANRNLPGPLDPRTLYLIFQDKIFVGADIAVQDPTWQKIMPRSRPGDLWYPHVYDADVAPGGEPPDVSAVPEFFGDTILVNGIVYPFVEVERRQYRLRLLNACNARFLNPRLVYAKGPWFPASTEASTVAGPAFVQFGTEGGFLPSPTVVNAPGTTQLLLAPAERADLIVDFRDVPAGSTLILLNDAAAPYPGGDPPVGSTPGFGPDTRTLLQFRVTPRKGPADRPISLPARLHPTDPFILEQVAGVPTEIPDGVPVRYLTLNEDVDAFGRLIQFLGTDTSVNGAFGRAYMDTPTEVIAAGSSEVWAIANLSEDTHPIHFHLVNGQVLMRRPFDPGIYTGGVPTDLGEPIAPDLNELGWKETVRMSPAQVTYVHMRFDLPTVPYTVPASPRLTKEYGIRGAEYVWHCHILEHEEHDMMRPLVIE